MHRTVGTDALDLLTMVVALHDAPDTTAMLAALPHLVHRVVPHDALVLLGVPGSAMPDLTGQDHRLAVHVPDGGGVLAGLILARRERPFAAGEIAVAGLLGPLLASAADHVRLRELHATQTVRLTALTDREHEVLALVAAGHTGRDIARLLSIRPRTVEKHMEHLRAKLGVHSRAEASAAWARAVALAS